MALRRLEIFQVVSDWKDFDMSGRVDAAQIRSFTLRAPSVALFAKRVVALRHAVRKQGGGLLCVQWSCDPKDDAHTAEIRYWLPHPSA